MNISIVNNSIHPTPSYQTDGSAGMDLYANIHEDIEIKALQRILVPTGIFIALPVGIEAQIRPRSGLAVKHGITCLNTPGTIDSDYRGEIKVILINLSNESHTIKNGDRIAQMVISKYEKISWDVVNELTETSRGKDGFGSTG